MGRVRVGTSGWTYAEWRGVFYPPGLPQRLEPEHVAARLPTVELNASFYALQRPQSYLSWAQRTPPGFRFSVKGWRAVTHERRLVDVQGALAGFFGSGVLALGEKLGAVLWQLPPSLRFDPEVMARFCALLPRTTTAAAELAASRAIAPGTATSPGTVEERPLRHAVEVRHRSHESPELADVLRAHGVALVTADTGGRWPLLLEQTADFSYVRLHGSPELYVSGYGDAALEDWATRVQAWSAGERDVFVYFDNTMAARAPFDALALARLLLAGSGASDD
ncbi:DUF72 domain-containing protein [Paenibacillus sp. TRM 82003]|uniref:DUF72 domain-containing protein n=1 Tax=Kineococcus sp. TRM81007 TaxID=2925831 RepID=UPI001F5AD77D|nr:DUF72 domain-containing protein [Kineococcus sp. TRM81007]MCI2238686.1 DUF72 domain-containing protein [Kineococcus sp. TRM81007]MCI3927348.1 DUF72 domain-containing protein [Paenibacillus sp. TRM 82003]